MKRFRLLRTSPLSGPLTLAGPVARADSLEPVSIIAALVAAANSGNGAAAAQYAAPGLVLPMPGGATWALGGGAPLSPALLPITASAMTPDPTGVDGVLQFGSAPPLTAHFAFVNGAIAGATLNSQTGVGSEVFASAAAVNGATVTASASDGAVNAATAGVSTAGSASADSSVPGHPVTCSGSGTVLFSLNGASWLCANGSALSS